MPMGLGWYLTHWWVSNCFFHVMSYVKKSEPTFFVIVLFVLPSTIRLVSWILRIVLWHPADVLRIFERIAIQVLYKHFRGVWGNAYFAYLGVGGGPEFWKTCIYNTCTLPKFGRWEVKMVNRKAFISILSPIRLFKNTLGS